MPHLSPSRSRTLDQAFDSAQALLQREQTHGFEKAAGPGEIGGEFYRDHTAVATADSMHLHRGQRVLRMRREPRIMDALNLGLRLQPNEPLIRNLLGRGCVAG